MPWLAVCALAALTSGPGAGQLQVLGVTMPAGGFHLDFVEGRDAWLAVEASGLELHVASRDRGDGSVEDALGEWLEDLPEETGFRLLDREERQVAAGRAWLRSYGDRADPASSWRTEAALVLTPVRALTLTLLVPPGAEGARVLRELVLGLGLGEEPSPPSAPGSKAAGKR